MTFTPADLARLKASFDQLPESIRREYQTAERLVAAIMIDFPGGNIGFAGIGVTGQSQAPNGQVLQDTIHQYNDGFVRTRENRYAKDEDGRWRIFYSYGGGRIEQWAKDAKQGK